MHLDGWFEGQLTFGSMEVAVKKSRNEIICVQLALFNNNNSKDWACLKMTWVQKNISGLTKRKQWETHSLVKWYLHLFYGLSARTRTSAKVLSFLTSFLPEKYSFDQCARGWIVITTLTRQKLLQHRFICITYRNWASNNSFFLIVREGCQLFSTVYS
jgi:hypothetical protein